MRTGVHERLLRVLLTVVIPLVRGVMLPLLSLEVAGRHRLPRTGPFLLLSNHVGFLDPVALTVACGRPVHFIGSESLLKSLPMRLFVRTCGFIPTQKSRSDLTTLKLMRAWAKVGGAVGVFPEGRRTWDGRPVSLLPGIEKVARFLGVPVVTARIINADRQAPFWAVHQRRGHVRIEIDPPVAPSADAAALRDTIVSGVAVDPATSRRWPTRGRRLAEGITNLLFACPECATAGALVEAGNTLRCRRCAALWSVTTENTLIRSGSGQVVEVAGAYAAVLAQLRAGGWLPDPQRFRDSGEILRSEPMALLGGPRQRRVVARGALVLTETTVSVDGPRPWRCSLAGVAAIAVDVRTRLMFRTPSRLFEAVLPTDSAIKWMVVGEHWRQRARAAALAAAAGEGAGQNAAPATRASGGD